MPTAAGKVTAASLIPGDRIQLRITRQGAVPSATKVKGAIAATVTKVESAMNGRNMGRRVSAHAGGLTWFLTVSASQTFWRTPS